MLLNKKSKDNKNTINQIMVNNKTISDPSKIADAFNEFFCSIGKKLSEKIETISESPLKYLANFNSQNSLYLYPTTIEEVSKTVSNMKHGFATGHDSLNNSILKHIINCILDPLVHIINSSLQNGVFPEKMKIAKVIPLYKSGDSKELGNYRPISILPTMSKILEKIVAKRLRGFLESNDLFYGKQFGFRTSHSTELAINYLNSQLCKSVDKGHYSCGIFLDLSKAFDTVNIDILLLKMEKYGIRGLCLDWFKSYLHDRQQYVSINNDNSKTLSLSCGVPQGSVLGPILFLIYINDIHKSSSKLNFISFADDTTAYYSDNSIESMIDVINNELKLLNIWLKLNKLTLNVAKTKYIIFSSTMRLHKLKNKHHNALIINDQTVERVNNIKFLGVILTDNLKWDKHINMLANKLSKSIGILTKLKYFLPSNILLKIYNILVLPHLNYCIGVWGNTESYNLERLFLLQKKAIRSIGHTGFLDHTAPLFKRFKLLKIKEMVRFSIGKFMYKYNNKASPHICDDIFTKCSEVHDYKTRQSNSGLIKIPAHKTALFGKSLSVSGPKIWNSIPSNIRNAQSFNSFKMKYKIHLCNQP